MAHVEQRKFVSLMVEHFIGRHTSNIKVLEIGSYVVNLSVRDFFASDCEYLGVDLVAGPGVDLVGSGHEVDLPDASFDVVISCEAFEHNPYWVETFRNMYRMTQPGGIVGLTCASRGRVEHGTMRSETGASPGTEHVGIDYYMNLNANDFKKAFKLDEMFERYFFHYLSTNHDLYFFGLKKGDSQFVGDVEMLKADVHEIWKLSPHVTLPLLHRMMGALYRLPITASAYLFSDRTFQNFRFRYLRISEPLKVGIKNIFRLSIQII